MKEEEIIEGNKLIAEFMGERVNKYHESTFPENMKYHSSWDWLMPVVESIERTEPFPTTKIIYNGIESYTCIIGSIVEVTESRIKSVWKAVIQFIKWYNSNKP